MSKVYFIVFTILFSTFSIYFLKSDYAVFYIFYLFIFIFIFYFYFFFIFFFSFLFFKFFTFSNLISFILAVRVGLYI